MKRWIVTTLLAFGILVSTVPSAEATALFPATAEYTGQFVDVARTDWFYDHVATLYALGLTNGKGDTSTFQPKSDMSVAEVVTLAARLRSLYEYGAAETGAAAYRTAAVHWYAPYVSYLKECGVIGTELNDRWDNAATRAEVAHILANALPAELFSDINAEAVSIGYARRHYIADVTEYTAYQSDILTLYRWGIVSGRDTVGTFEPEETIWRSEVAAMVTRLVDSDLRLTLAWHEDAPASLAELVYSEGVRPKAPAPNDEDAIDTALRYMLARGESTLTFDYGTGTLTRTYVDSLMEAFLKGIRRYAEQDYNSVGVSYYTNGVFTVIFGNTYDEDTSVHSRRNAIFSAAEQVRDALYESGMLRDTMSEYEKAKVYYTWLCNYCEYGDTKERAHSAYGVFFDQMAVCDGYTAAYNLLLKLEGIACIAVDSETENHMWTIATLDGITYHIDPTWGDQKTRVDYRYFAMTAAQAYARFH